MENTTLTDRQFIIVEVIEYDPGAPVIKTVLRKNNSDATSVTFVSDDAFIEKTTHEEMFLQVIEGSTEISVNDKTSTLEVGQALKIPAHSRYRIRELGHFKLTLTTIKNGHD